ncbi:PREDICTED: protein FAM26F [Crocodylus porosus]|uniref:Calcium homeostasis modulator family member 6 n=1 Tax=Crocodylus porosus TaxID=8502 RepID=A0A7M4E5M2_CROPO|nr:PREDICTED: protein FAM26F [Crocodylus porosus]
MEKFYIILDMCLSHKKVLGFSAVSLLTMGSERIFSAAVFKCPCNSWSMLYGLAFLLLPALVLFLLGYLLNTRTWKLLTGCCASRKRCSCSSPAHLSRCLQVLWLSTVSSAVAPLTWIAVALLSASFYECAVSGSSMFQNYLCKEHGPECRKQVAKIPCGGTLPKELQNELTSLQAQSQVLGWILIAGFVTFVLISTCIKRCRSPVSFLQLKFWKIYLKKEQEFFDNKAKEHAAKMAERNVSCYFDSIELEPFYTPSNKAWWQISSLYAFNTKEQYYSMIHKYVSSEKDKSISSAEGDMFPQVLGFVDETETQIP